MSQESQEHQETPMTDTTAPEQAIEAFGDFLAERLNSAVSDKIERAFGPGGDPAEADTPLVVLPTADAAWLNEIIDRRRAEFAGWSMSIAGTEAATDGGDGSDGGDSDGSSGGDSAGEDDGDAGTDGDGDNPDGEDTGDGSDGDDDGDDSDLPDTVKAKIAKANREAANLRKRLNEAPTEETLMKSVLEKITAALGGAPEGQEDEPVTVEGLTESLTAAQAETRTLQVQSAVLMEAFRQGVNGAALLDEETQTVAFQRKLGAIDPTDGDAVRELVTAALAAQPSLAIARAASASSPDHNGGGSSTDEDPSTEALLAARQKRLGG